MTIARSRVLAVLAVLIGGNPLAGQDPDAEQCAAAARAIAARDTSVASWVRGYISQCPDGGVAVAAAWRGARNDPLELAELRWWSRQHHDQRIMNAVIDVARDESRADAVRFVAFQVLITYLEPAATIPIERLKNPPAVRAHIGSSTLPAPTVGREPIGADAGARVAAVFQELTTVDPSPGVRAAARYLWEAVASQYADQVPLPDGSLAISNVCGGRFRVTNRIPIDVSVTIILGDSRPLRWGARANASVESDVAGEGKVRMERAGKVLGEASYSTQPCPRP